MMTRPIVRVIMSQLVLLCVLATIASGRQAANGQDGWRATVKTDRLAVYSRMSESSSVVKLLEKGSVVTVDLEVRGPGESWSSVTAPGQTASLGYVRSEGLEREEPQIPTSWVFLPPAVPTEVTPASEERQPPFVTASIGVIRQKVAQFFVSRFGRSLPVSAYGQTALHERMRFNHKNAIDVAVHPDSSEGRALQAYLRSMGIPFIGFRYAVRGAATGAHIHVGLPSPRK